MKKMKIYKKQQTLAENIRKIDTSNEMYCI